MPRNTPTDGPYDVPYRLVDANSVAFSISVDANNYASPISRINTTEAIKVEYRCRQCDMRLRSETHTLDYILSTPFGAIPCNECSTLVRPRFIITSSGFDITPWVPTSSCDRCGIRGGSDIRLYEPLSQMLCRACMLIMRQQEVIKGHNWSPDAFNRTAGKHEKVRIPIYYGTELEINTKTQAVDHAREFESWLKSNGMGEFFYFKRDGSLRTGYEIVTHPLTAQARHERIDWKAICQYLRDTGATSEESGECGLHIHASRNALTDREIGKMKYFLFANRMQIHKLSRRTNYRYCAFEPYSISNNRCFTEARAILKYIPDSLNRYTALNIHTGKPTIEFRFMRGTLDHKRLLASFQLIDSLIHFAKAHSVMTQDKPYSWSTYRLWIKEENRYNHLDRYLTKEG